MKKLFLLNLVFCVIINLQPLHSQNSKYKDCDECRGTGRNICYGCNGSGYFTCIACKGSGVHPLFKCKYCNGYGAVSNGWEIIKCNPCRGTGNELCNSCSGNGKNTCNGCQGVGKINCDRCKGTGRIKTIDISTSSDSQNLNNIPAETMYKVKVSKAFFYSNPYQQSSRKNSYFVYGETFYSNQSVNGFVYTVFTNAWGKTTAGWIGLQDISKQ